MSFTIGQDAIRLFERMIARRFEVMERNRIGTPRYTIAPITDILSKKKCRTIRRNVVRLGFQ